MQYALTYILITFVVLLFLNIYCAKATEQLFMQSKQIPMTERTKQSVKEIVASKSLTPTSAADAVSRAGLLRYSRVMVTDHTGALVFDYISDASSATDTLPNEVLTALTGEEALYWKYSGGVIVSSTAIPIFLDHTVAGCIYVLEVDKADGMLMEELQNNIFNITFILELLLILFAAFYVRRYSRRMRQITASMQIIQNGDYSHKLDMRGYDELAFLAREFNAMTERLQISEKKRQQFVSDASHEIKTPLASIKLLSDSILQYDMDMETIREFAGDISQEAERLNRMTMKLLALTKDVENTASDEAEIIYMTPTIQRVVNMLDGIAKSSNISIQMDLRQDVPVLIQEDDLYQITFNLVENGIKYNVPGGTLSISLHRQEDMAVLRISDTGVGIPPESLGHVFERFYRVDKARARQSGGSGLGLSIVRNMVERNHGEIHLQSTVGKGTTFAVAFPAFDTIEEEENEELE